MGFRAKINATFPYLLTSFLFTVNSASALQISGTTLPRYDTKVSLLPYSPWSLTIPNNQNTILVSGLDSSGFFPTITATSTLFNVPIDTLIPSNSGLVGMQQYASLVSSLDGDRYAANIGPAGSGFIIGNSTGVISGSVAIADLSNLIFGYIISNNYFQPVYSRTNNNTLYALEFKNDYPPSSGGTFYTFDSTGSITGSVYYGSAVLQGNMDVNDTRMFISSGIYDLNPGTVYYGTLSNPATLAEFPTAPNPSFLAVTPDGQKLYVCHPFTGTGTSNGSISIYDINSSEPVLVPSGTPSISAPINSTNVALCFSYDGNQAYFVTNEFNLGVIDAVSDTFIGTVGGDYTRLGQIAASFDSPYDIYALDINEGLVKFTFSSLPPPPGPTNLNFYGQANEMYNYLTFLSTASLLPPNTQAIFNTVQGFSSTDQANAYLELAPQFKVLQFSEEKLDLLLHKELQDELYRKNVCNQGFILGGYDHLEQSRKTGYVGYSVNNFYQLAGYCFNKIDMNWLLALGASESYMNLHPTRSYANANTVWGSFGTSKGLKRWDVGLDALFGYSFLNTNRNVTFLNSKANSSHGLWNLSFDFKAAYTFMKKGIKMTPYDIFGYIYGYENPYSESGIPGDNLYVKNEQISEIRNQLGFRVAKDFKMSWSLFVDAAWVYEYYTNSNAYKASLIGVDYAQIFNQIIPTKNYGRIHAGFEGTKNRFMWKLSYTGLYGHRYSDSSVSLKLGHKF